MACKWQRLNITSSDYFTMTKELQQMQLELSYLTFNRSTQKSKYYGVDQLHHVRSDSYTGCRKKSDGMRA